MIRLAVIDAHESLQRELAPRLRGVMLDATLSTCDAVIFLATPNVGDRAIEDCVAAGKRVLLSAGAALSKERLQTLSALTRSHFGIVNPDRYLPSRQLIRQHLDAGKLGQPGLIRLHRWEPAGANGSPLRDLDLVLWYFGYTPNLVYAVESSVGVQVHLGFPGGGMALLDHANRLPAGDGYNYLSVIGSCGAAYADVHQNMQLVFRGGAPQAIAAHEGILHWTTIVQEYVDSIVAHDSNRVGAGTRWESYATKSWHTVLNVQEAVQMSLQTKQAVAPEEVP